MKITSKLALLFTILFLFASEHLIAQKGNNLRSLSDIFATIQKQYNVQFNYAEDNIAGILITPPDETLTLEEVLLYLEEKTDLVFEIDGGFILVTPNDEVEVIQRQNLAQVVISSFLVKGINKLDDGSFNVDFTNFDILPGLNDTDVLQAVQAFPGIQSINETVSNINIRGGTHDQNLILWDNIKMYQSGHFFGLISMYNPQITQRVDLIKNGTDVAYTDGVSGIISMQTDNAINTNFSGSIGANFIDANGFADVPINEKSSIQFAARKSISDFIETPMYKNFFDRISQDTEVELNSNSVVNSDKQFDFYDVSLRWLYKISENDELRVNFINVNNELIFDESAVIDQFEETRQSSLSQNSIAGAIYYKRNWNEVLQSSLEIYETDYKLKAINANILDSQRFLQENVVSETSVKLKTNYSLNNQFNLLSGYHFVETEITNLDDVDVPIIRTLVSEVVRTHGLFSQITYKSKDKTSHLKLGLRFNYIDKFKKQIWEPRLSFTKKIKAFTLEFLGEFKHQNTSQIINFQNDFLGIEKRRWQLSNDDDIPVIMSKQASLGLSYNDHGWLFNIEGYAKHVDGITTQSQGFQNQYEFVKSSGSYDVAGIDVLLRKRVKQFNAWLSYSYMNNEYHFEDLPDQKFRSNFDITHALTLGTSYSKNRFKCSAGLNWHSGKPTTSPVFNNEIVDGTINFETANTSRLKDYLRVDLSAMYDFKISEKIKAQLGVSVWNVLNENNEIDNFYRINNGVVNETLQNSLGWTPNAIFRLHF